MPLLPDFIDLAPTSTDLIALNHPSLLDSRRENVLLLINNIRASFGAANIYLDARLNELAQNYSSLQIQQKFIGHIDKLGMNAAQRAKAAGIYEKIGENIAVDMNLTQAQLRLQRSPCHLRTIVNPSWTRVGLGIVQNNNQQYYLTQ